ALPTALDPPRPAALCPTPSIPAAPRLTVSTPAVRTGAVPGSRTPAAPPPECGQAWAGSAGRVLQRSSPGAHLQDVDDRVRRQELSPVAPRYHSEVSRRVCRAPRPRAGTGTMVRDALDSRLPPDLQSSPGRHR